MDAVLRLVIMVQYVTKIPSCFYSSSYIVPLSGAMGASICLLALCNVMHSLHVHSRLVWTE